jgi:hypothetical protein
LVAKTAPVFKAIQKALLAKTKLIHLQQSGKGEIKARYGFRGFFVGGDFCAFRGN